MNATDEKVERDIRWIRESYGWNYSEIAQALGISRWRVYKTLLRNNGKKAA